MASTDEPAEWIVATRGAKTLPTVEVLTGRGFITGKSGSGKSNTASVIAEELLENHCNLLIVDPEGEYYGLKERYELLHVGADEFCDVQVGPEHADKLAEIALERNVPIILDVSDFLDGEEAQELIGNVVRALYQREKDVRKPFLLMIEEMQEYLPQTGGTTELAKLLERVAKRGRKRGLGMLGMSQRPSSVDKNFITQCDWMVWHRLTWKNDLDVVRNILGSEKSAALEDFETGEAYLMTDWDDLVERVKFKRKRTHDAGATPGLEQYEPPDLKSVGGELIRELQSQSTGQVTLDEEAGGSTDVEDEAVLEDAVDDIEILGDPIDDPGLADEEVGELEDEDARQYVDRLKRQNRVLEDEVRELRSVLEQTEPVAGAEGSGDEAPFAGKAAGANGAAPTPSKPAAPPAKTGANRPARPTRRRPATPPQRPRAPEPPEDRSGVSGTLVEFVEMLTYLRRSLVYRLKLAVYRARVGNRDRQR